MTGFFARLFGASAAPVAPPPAPSPTAAQDPAVPAAVVDLVAEFEGYRAEAYLCPARVWTIGYGSTRIHGRAVRQSDRLTDEAQGRAMLQDDLRSAADTVAHAVRVPLSEGERGALISIIHNVGPGRADRPGAPGRDGIVTLRSGAPSTLLRLLNAGDKAGAADQFPAWRFGGGVVLPGLVRRREAERAMFLGGAIPAAAPKPPSQAQDDLIQYFHWRDVPASAWRWPNFQPQELACKGTGQLLIRRPALDALQALRTDLGKPMRITSAYRSPSHNAKQPGASPNSRHMLGDAFDVKMVGHDPAAFEAAARRRGFTGFGYYPEDGFMHIDMGPARVWGDRFPPGRWGGEPNL